MQILKGEEPTTNIDNQDYLTAPIEISKASNWITAEATKQSLSDSKVRQLLSDSQTSRLSNSPSENVVLRQLLTFMNAVLDEVERIDHRFKATLELAGSSREGTKVKLPDEFDLLCFLDNFHSLCQIEEADNNFVYCRINSDNSHDYENLCHTNNLLSAYKLTSSFYFCIRKALSNPVVWEFAEGFSLDSTQDDFKSEEDLSGIQCLHFRYSDVLYKNLAISCDIVPAIRVKNWWPSFARKAGRLVSDDVKANGCMVIVKSQKEFTLSREKVRVLSKFAVSVYLSECSVLLSAPEFVRQAYKLAKLLLKEKSLYPPLTEEKLPDVQEDMAGYSADDNNDIPPPLWYHPAADNYLITSYMMKNALLYELDRDYPQRETEDSPSKIDDNKDIVLITSWAQRIFRRLLQNFETDYFPAYFLPQQLLTVKVESNEETLTDITCTFCRMIITLLERSCNSEQNSNL